MKSGAKIHFYAHITIQIIKILYDLHLNLYKNLCTSIFFYTFAAEINVNANVNKLG